MNVSSRRIDIERFLRFCTVGASGVVVNLSALWLAREHLFARITPPALRLNAALGLAITLATLNNFFWNRHWTWRDRRSSASVGGAAAQLGQYAVAVAVGSTVQVVLTNLLAARVHYLVANAASILAAAAANFALNDIWTFRAGASRRAPR